jgi:hypothetical protein
MQGVCQSLRPPQGVGWAGASQALCCWALLLWMLLVWVAWEEVAGHQAQGCEASWGPQAGGWLWRWRCHCWPRCSWTERRCRLQGPGGLLGAGGLPLLVRLYLANTDAQRWKDRVPRSKVGVHQVTIREEEQGWEPRGLCLIWLS